MAPGSAASADRIPFNLTACPFDVPDAVAARIRCGEIKVPESWERADSRRIRIPVAVVRADAGSSPHTPVIAINGGPMPDLGRVPQIARSQAWRDRDVVLFDFRGMGAGDVICPESGPAYARVLTARLDVEASLAARAQLAEDCRQWADAAGVDLGAYNARSIARDVLAMVAALGYERWSVDTMSFGTAVAQHLMRLQPAGLEAVVLRGAVPLHVETLPVDGFARALDRLAAYCAADPACAAAFPDPRGAYQAAFEQLEREPLLARVPADAALLPTGEIHVTGSVLQRIVSDGLYSRLTLAALPQLVHETARGNAAPAGTIGWLASRPASAYNGANWAAGCDLFAAVAASVPPAYGRADAHYVFAEARARCAALGVAAAPAADRQPVASALPTLLLVGEHDPITPPAYSTAIASHLDAATVIEVPGRGHELLGRCYDQIAAAFLANPRQSPDESCLAALPAVPFITDVHAKTGPGRLLIALRGGEYGWLAGLLLPVLVLAGSLAAPPAAALIRRLRGRPAPVRGACDRWLRIGAAALAVLAVAYAATLGWIGADLLASSPLTLVFGLPSAAAPLGVVPWVLLAGGAALLVAVATRLRRRTGARADSRHAGLVGVAALLLGAVLVALGFA